MEVKKCSQPGCTFNVDGKCLEGLGDACTHQQLQKAVASETITTEGATPAKTPNNNVKLYMGEELSFKEVSFITHKYPYKLILIVGDYDSGKTTLLATLFDMFQTAPVKDFLFAGSLTQIGFEKRCHDSRVPSNRNTPQTERTKGREFSFLHLAVKRKDLINEKATNLLLSDVSGERFKLARDSSASMQEISFIKDSDHIIIIVDGKKISDPKTRNLEFTNSERFIQMALDTGVFDGETTLRIVLSKWDLLHRDNSFNFELHIEKHFDDLFAKKVKNISYSKIAARPFTQDGDMKLGFGIYELLNEWSSPKMSKAIPLDIPKSKRAFSNYQFIENHSK